jgi:Gluconate 2-dehydrogenase subunit 3
MSDHSTIDRREAIRRVSALLGGVAFVGGTTLVSACEKGWSPQVTQAGSGIGEFNKDDVVLLDEVADTILPDTKTPGAKAAQVGSFMALMVTDTYSPRDQKIFRDGMQKLDDASRKASNASFLQSTPQQRLSLLETLDKEQKAYSDRVDAAKKAKKAGTPIDTTGGITPDSPPHYFRMMKELTLIGYFTSEIGMTQALRYVESPGRFDPCLPYTPGEKAWAGHA